MEASLADLVRIAALYAFALFVLGAVENWRYGLLLAGLSLLTTVVGVGLHLGTWGMLAAQIGLFLGITLLRLLASALRPRSPSPERVSASYRGTEAAGGEAGSSFARAVISALVFVLVLVAPFAIAIVAVGGLDLSEDFVQFMMITGVVGIALVLVFLWPLLVPALMLASWAAGRVFKDRGDRPP